MTKQTFISKVLILISLVMICQQSFTVLAETTTKTARPKSPWAEKANQCLHAIEASGLNNYYLTIQRPHRTDKSGDAQFISLFGEMTEGSNKINKEWDSPVVIFSEKGDMLLVSGDGIYKVPKETVLKTVESPAKTLRVKHPTSNKVMYLLIVPAEKKDRGAPYTVAHIGKTKPFIEQTAANSTTPEDKTTVSNMIVKSLDQLSKDFKTIDKSAPPFPVPPAEGLGNSFDKCSYVDGISEEIQALESQILPNRSKKNRLQKATI